MCLSLLSIETNYWPFFYVLFERQAWSWWWIWLLSLIIFILNKDDENTIYTLYIIFMHTSCSLFFIIHHHLYDFTCRLSPKLREFCKMLFFFKFYITVVCIIYAQIQSNHKNVFSFEARSILLKKSLILYEYCICTNEFSTEWRKHRYHYFSFYLK